MSFHGRIIDSVAKWVSQQSEFNTHEAWKNAGRVCHISSVIRALYTLQKQELVSKAPGEGNWYGGKYDPSKSMPLLTPVSEISFSASHIRQFREESLGEKLHKIRHSGGKYYKCPNCARRMAAEAVRFAGFRVARLAVALNDDAVRLETDKIAWDLTTLSVAISDTVVSDCDAAPDGKKNTLFEDIVEYTKTHEEFTTKDLFEGFSGDTPTGNMSRIGVYLRTLKHRGEIEHIGTNQFGHWRVIRKPVVTEEMVEPVETEEEADGGF